MRISWPMIAGNAIVVQTALIAASYLPSCKSSATRGNPPAWFVVRGIRSDRRPVRVHLRHRRTSGGSPAEAGPYEDECGLLADQRPSYHRVQVSNLCIIEALAEGGEAGPRLDGDSPALCKS